MSYKIKLPFPADDANKYSRGKLVVIAGSARYPGAAVLAARASQRMGAGYTEVITAKKAVKIVCASSPSLVVRPFAQWDPGELPASQESKPCAVCIGPGFTGSDAEADLVTRVLGKAKCPVLIDGGALGTLTSRKALKRLAQRAESDLTTVVTPHGGEAARLAHLAGLTCSNPKKLAAGLALSLRSIVVLKGPDTYISDGMRTIPMTEGTSALAKAGTGDVLAGMIGALLAQGAKPVDASYAAATLHAQAGSLASETLTAISVTAEDVIEHIPQAIKKAHA